MIIKQNYLNRVLLNRLRFSILRPFIKLFKKNTIKLNLTRLIFFLNINYQDLKI
jgi:predicted transcriptional regulator